MNTKYKIHFFYIILGLVSIIIFLVVIEWTEKEELVKYISFASTIASLLLALLAIVYAYLSNFSFTKNITLINEVSTDLKRNSDSLTRISESIEEDFISTLQGMDKKLFDLPQKISEISNLAAQDTHKGSKEKKEVKEEKKNNPQIDIDLFLRISSWNGLVISYACVLAYLSKKAFNIDDFGSKFDFTQTEYFYGFLVAIHSCDLISYTISKRLINVTSVNKELSEKIKEAMLNMAQNRENPESKWGTDIELVEKYFD